jgi:hypothetical protein
MKILGGLVLSLGVLFGGMAFGSDAPKIVCKNGVVTITDGINKVVLNGKTVVILGKGPEGSTNQTWTGDVHVTNAITHVNTSEQTPVVLLSNMAIIGFCSSQNTTLACTVVSGNRWYVVYDNTVSRISVMSVMLSPPR